MREWMNPYNPFNSLKALMWREWFEGLAREDYLVPVTVDTDPAYRCNFDCLRCNAFECMKSNTVMPAGHLARLADFYAQWGTRSTCVAGGGEPLLNEETPAFLQRLTANGLESGVITNGSLITDATAEIMARCCRWVGISVDAATNGTFAKIKQVRPEMFTRVVANCKRLTAEVTRQGSACDVAFKFLIHPENAHEVYPAAELAKQLGCQHFHCRPVGWDNIAKTEGRPKPVWTPRTVAAVNEQIERAFADLTCETFEIFGVRHKFNPNLSRKVTFKRCWAAPLILTFGADGNCHLCFDIRGRRDLILCRHEPDPREVLKHWNTDRHREMLRRIDVNSCPRCTFGPYNEIVEQVFIQDKMCRLFP